MFSGLPTVNYKYDGLPCLGCRRAGRGGAADRGGPRQGTTQHYILNWLYRYLTQFLLSWYKSGQMKLVLCDVSYFLSSCLILPLLFIFRTSSQIDREKKTGNNYGWKQDALCIINRIPCAFTLIITLIYFSNPIFINGPSNVPKCPGRRARYFGEELAEAAEGGGVPPLQHHLPGKQCNSQTVKKI